MHITSLKDVQAVHRAELVTALLSGDYDQGKEKLQQPNGEFCCLGVACDQSGLGAWQNIAYGESGKSVMFYTTDGIISSTPEAHDFHGKYSSIDLPRLVTNHYGFATNNGAFIGNDEYNPTAEREIMARSIDPSGHAPTSMTDANDRCGWTFVQIAQAIAVGLVKLAE